MSKLIRLIPICCAMFMASSCVAQRFNFDSLLANGNNYNNQIAALQKLDSTLLVTELSQTNNDQLKVKLLNALCWKNFYDQPNTALAFANQQNELVESIGFEEARIPSNDNLAHLYNRLGNYQAASKHLLKSLEAYRAKNDTAGIIVSGFGVGNVLFELKQFEEAYEYWRECYVLARSKKDTVKLGQATANLGLVCRKLNLEEESEQHYLEFNRLAELKPDDPFFQSVVAATNGDLALLYLTQNRVQLAKKHFNLALAASQDRKHNITDLIGLSSCMKLENKTDSMFYHARQAKGLLAENFLTQEGIELYEHMADLHAYDGNADSAYSYMKQAFELRDTLITSYGLDAIAEMRTKFETERVENEARISVLEADARASVQKLYTFLALMGIGLLVIVAGFLIHGNRIQGLANRQLQSANLFIEGQRDQIQQINNNLTASIDYAKLIQDAVLPSDARLSEGLNEAFVIFKPRDVVSGDFYWYHEVGSQIFVAAADCTGHGVPGAFVSMVCHGLLNKIVIEDQVLDPAEILKRAHLGVLSLFKTESTIGQANDGMDIALTIWDKAKKELNFAGAMNPCYVVRNNQIIELEANRRSIGGVSEKEFSFVGQKINLEDRDMVYIFSDGYKDQFGGPRGKKFMNSRLKKLMLSVADKAAAEQKSIFETEFTQWKQDEDQIDDVLLMGYRIS